MKHWFSIAVAISTSITLTGCNDSSKVFLSRNAGIPTVAPDYSEVSVADYVIEVTASQTLALIASKEDFVLYIGNATCSSCESFRPALVEYVYHSKALVYHFDNYVNFDTYDELPEAYPDYFNDQYPPTPSLYFFKNGEMTAKRVGSTRMFAYNTFNPIMGGYTNLDNINFVYTESTLDQVIMQDKSIVYFYSRSNLPSNEFYINNLFPYIKGLSETIYVVDIDMMRLAETEVANFKSKYGISSITGVFAKYSTSALADSITLSSGNQTDVLDWVKSQY